MEQANTGYAPVGGIGDVTSTAKGSGARYNSGKPPLELIPLRLLADYYSGLGGFAHGARSSQEDAAILCLRALGRFQERGTRADLLDALLVLGNHWNDCAHVFDYGRRKYAEWNWAKGMKWSVPLGCAARHLEKIILGQADDDESGLSHAGHAYCNVVMLYTYTLTFHEGDDRPPDGYLYPESVASEGPLPHLARGTAVAQGAGDEHEALTFHELMYAEEDTTASASPAMRLCVFCKHYALSESAQPCKGCLDACARGRDRPNWGAP